MLVVCTNIEKLPNVETAEFEVGKIYRHVVITDGEIIQHMVYGVIFFDKVFKECFKDYAEIIKERARKIFYENGKPITKKNFRENYADVHQYGKRTSGFKAVYVGHPKINCFAIRPFETYTKAKSINFAYDVMVELCEGNVSSIDANRVRWLNTGYPISMNPNQFWTYGFDTEFTPKGW